MYSNKQIHVDVDTIVSFVLQSRLCQRAEQSPSRVMLTVTVLNSFFHNSQPLNLRSNNLTMHSNTEL